MKAYLLEQTLTMCLQGWFCEPCSYTNKQVWPYLLVVGSVITGGALLL